MSKSRSQSDSWSDAWSARYETTEQKPRKRRLPRLRVVAVSTYKAVRGGPKASTVVTVLGVLLIHETREFVSWQWERDECRRIRRTHAEEQRPEEARQRVRAKQTDHDPCDRQTERASDDEHQQSRTSRA